MLDIYECDRMLYPPEDEPVDTGMKCPRCGEQIFCGEVLDSVEIGETESVCHHDCISPDVRDFIEAIGGEIRVFELYRDDFV